MALELEEILLRQSDDDEEPAHVKNSRSTTMKFVIVGDSGVGKTALSKRFVNNSFPKIYTQTVGVNYYSSIYKPKSSSTINSILPNENDRFKDDQKGGNQDGNPDMPEETTTTKKSNAEDLKKKEDMKSHNYTVHILDISGFERFSGVTQQYYQNSVGAIVVFDLTSERSLEIAGIWKKDVDLKAKAAGDKPIPCLLVGMKYDLIDNAAGAANNKKKGHEQCKPESELKSFCDENGFIGLVKVSALRGQEDTRKVFDTMMNYVIDNDVYALEAECGENVQERSRWCC